jgi:hypothetical protein
MDAKARFFVLALCAIAIVTVLPSAHRRAAPATAATNPYAKPSQASRARGFSFSAVSPGDQQLILTAVAGAQPEARRLIDAVAGLGVFQVGPSRPGTAGTTTSGPDHYDVVLDLALVQRGLGARGIERLVLHELGHVVQFALVPAPLAARLDQEIPRGYGCEDGVSGVCAQPAERFAETFAKWASDDIGVGLSIGYKVPPPSVTLATWAAPLTALAR